MNQSRITHMAKLMADLGVENRLQIQNAIVPGNPAGYSGGMGFDVNVFEALSATAYDVQYPELLWNRTIPAASIDTSINPGARIASYRVRDRRGRGAFRAAVGKDIPVVGMSMNKVSIPIESGAVMTSVDIQDLRAVAFGFEGLNLLTEGGEAMREASERHIEDVFFFGFAELGFAGYIDYALTPATTVVGGSWATKTVQERVADIQAAIAAVYTSTKQLFVPNVVELPVDKWLMLDAPMGVGAENIAETGLQYLARNSAVTTISGKQLIIRPLRYLTGAGVGGTDRMIVSDDDPRNHYMPMPVPFTMLPPQDRQYATDVYADYRFGSYHSPYPTSRLYVDGI